MKKSIIQILFVLFLTGFLLSCHDHEDFVNPHLEKVSVEFDSAQVVVLENEEQHLIRLSFNMPAIQSGLLTLSLSNVSQSRFTIEPALTNGQISLNVSKDQQSATIKIKPLNNSLLDGNQEFDLIITSASEDFIIGNKKSMTVKFVDDDLPAPVQESMANFMTSDKRVSESETEGQSFEIQLSEPLQAVGSIELSVESAKAIYGTHYTTVPGSMDGKIVLNPAIGEDEVSFTVIPINNSIITGELEIKFTIVATTGSIVKGAEIIRDIVIVDDELTNKPKGYEVGGGQWALKKIFEYDEDGRVKYVHIEKSSPATSSRTETYYYDPAGRIQKINTYPQIDIVFTWVMGRITKSESIDKGVVKEYIEYDYDDNGNVSGTANYFRQQDGQFKLGFLNLYLYFLDNNLYKSQTYIPTEGSNEYTLISTRTYDGYLANDNPFPMVDILPTVKTQTHLPSAYTIEEHGVKLTYQFSYEFREDGRVSKRIARNGNLSETSLYLYY